MLTFSMAARSPCLSHGLTRNGFDNSYLGPFSTCQVYRSSDEENTFCLLITFLRLFRLLNIRHMQHLLTKENLVNVQVPYADRAKWGQYAKAVMEYVNNGK